MSRRPKPSRQTRPEIVEGPEPLSRSLLWRLQRNFYDRAGVQAWTEGIVPHYITSNPWIADGYARVVLGWLRDGVAAGTIDPAEPVHVVELGCGPGRFGYLFLNRLLDLLGRSSLAHLRVRYVLSDFTESNLDVLRSHPSLQALVAAGVLDFARYDAGRDDEIALSHSGDVLAPGSLRNPLTVIANYLFDGLPQDCFFFGEDGALEVGLVSLVSPRPEPIHDDPEILERVEIHWSRRAVVGAPYGEADLDRLLTQYGERLRSTALLFPVGALRCLRNLARLAGGRLLLLSADKGYCEEALLHGREEPGFAIHGSLSMMVNYHALGQFFREEGGDLLAATPLSTGLQVVAGFLGLGNGGSAETRLAFDDAVERRNPDDFFSLKIAVETGYPSLTLPQLLAWLRLSGWDANVFLGCLPLLVSWAEAESTSAVEREDLRAVALRVWETYFPIREARDLAFHVGALLCQLADYASALPCFESSLALYGPNPATLYNLGLCYFSLGQLDEAETCVDETLTAEPDLVEAQALRSEIAAARGTIL
jgi:tetratricopeptide (TPR) repeat protein